MPTFIYVAKNASGKPVKAKEFATSEYELKTRLARKNLTIISIKEEMQKVSANVFGSKIKTSELVLFCKQLATMVKGGVPLLRAINSISSEMRNPVFRAALEEISHLVKGGEALSAGFRRFPALFSSLFVSMIEAGEKVGSLDIMLERLSAYLLARDRLNKKIITAITYPAFVVVVFFVAVAVIVLKLIPKFKSIYSGLGAKLPKITQIVFSISDVIVRNIWPIAIITSIVIFFSYRYFFRTRHGRRTFDRMIIGMPVMGSVIKNASLSKISRMLATLLAQGVSIASALDLVGRSSGNIIIREAIDKMRSLILDGESIPEALKKTEIFPPLMIQMVTVGVESGNLPELLDKTADFYEDKVGDFVATLTTMIEPILIVSLGVVVGIVILAMYMPIFTLSQAATGMR